MRPVVGRDSDVEFEEFVTEHARELLYYAELLTGHPELAEDLLQTALVKAHGKWTKIRDGNPQAYIRTILLNGQRDWWRRGNWRERLVDVLPTEPSYADSAEASSMRDLVLRALASLTARERSVVVLRFYQDLSEAAIAHELGMAPGTVKSTLSRAIGKLRAIPSLNLSETTS